VSVRIALTKPTIDLMTGGLTDCFALDRTRLLEEEVPEISIFSIDYS